MGNVIPGNQAARLYAHTLPPPKAIDDWEPLEVHAAAVAVLAKEFANAFQAGDWGDLLGRWHGVPETCLPPKKKSFA